MEWQYNNNNTCLEQKRLRLLEARKKQSTVPKSCICHTCLHVQREQSTWKNSREQRQQLPDVTPGNNQNSNLHVHWPWSRCICATSGTIHRTWCKKQKLKKIKQLYQPTTRVEGSNQCKPLQPVEMEKNNQLPDKKQNHCSCMLHMKKLKKKTTKPSGVGCIPGHTLQQQKQKEQSTNEKQKKNKNSNQLIGLADK